MALNQTMEFLVPRSEDEIPVSTPPGGAASTDFEQLYTLLANRVSALETALADMQKSVPDIEPTAPTPEETPGEIAEETTETTDKKENEE